ncbi:MAG: sigma 54-interacting transcriptional regulator [Candidatus Marinimicrobia bacterium]|nr:sigma 54-interacting transcriptional regulator [Candidatus Neomarinimicrobiota bacterium]
MDYQTSIRHEYDACRIQRLKLEAIFDSVSDGIIALDADMRVTNFNRAAYTGMGFSRTEIAGMDFFDIFAISEDSDAQTFARALKSERMIDSMETKIRTKNGELKDIILNLSLLNDDSNNFAGYVITFRDISEIKLLKEEIKGRYRFGNIIGKSKLMQELYQIIVQVSQSTANVLIEGESGTGKELVAHAIHYNSPRADESFVVVNCSALPETLLESELFGHVRGAFTGAIRDKIGRFEAADRGTVFLDEIGDISPFIQLKLLRVLELKEFEKVGSNQTQKVDVRFIFATNKNLKKEVESGRFRLDLYYRLRVVPLTLPPLRERREDIPLLLDRFIQKFNNKTGKRIDSVSPQVRKAFLEYDWPGNIRELENAIEYAFVHCDVKHLTVEDLPKEIRSVQGTDALLSKYSLRDSSSDPRQLIKQALEDAKGNKTRAAKLLGIGRTTLWKKIKEYKAE